MNTQRQWVCPFCCAFAVRCAIVVRCPIVCLKGTLSKKTMIPYCYAAVGMWIVYPFSPILVLSRACGFSQTAQAITTFATAPHCFFRTIEWKGYCIFLKCYALKALFAYGYNDSLLLILIHGAGKSMLFPTASAITATVSLPYFLNTATRFIGWCPC